MIAAEGGLYTIFNSTVYPSTFKEIPDVVRWGQANIDKVQGLVFITYRTATIDTQSGVALDHEVDISKLSYTRESFSENFVTHPRSTRSSRRPARNTNPPATWEGAFRTPPINGWWG